MASTDNTIFTIAAEQIYHKNLKARFVLASHADNGTVLLYRNPVGECGDGKKLLLKLQMIQISSENIFN